MPILEAVTLAVVAFSCLALWIFGRKADRQREMHFAVRPDLPIGETWAQCDRAGISSDILEEALALVEEATGVSRTKLRAEDRFTVELAPEKGWEFDDGLVELQWALEARGVSPELEVLTVGDFAKAYATAPSIRPS